MHWIVLMFVILSFSASLSLRLSLFPTPSQSQVDPSKTTHAALKQSQRVPLSFSVGKTNLSP